MITFLVLHPRLFIPFRHNRLESLLAKSHDERRNVAAACNAVVLLTEERVCATVSKAHSPITSALEAPYALSPRQRCPPYFDAVHQNIIKHKSQSAEVTKYPKARVPRTRMCFMTRTESISKKERIHFIATKIELKRKVNSN